MKITTVFFLLFFVLSVPAWAIHPCQHCSSSTNQNFNFEVCNDNNDYIENQLVAANNETVIGRLANIPKLHQRNQFPFWIKPECVQNAMQSNIISDRMGTTRKGRFVKCDGPNNAPSRTSFKPCYSEKLHNLMTNSLNLVNKCLIDFVVGKNVDAESREIYTNAIFFKMAHESGLYFNILSETNAQGLSQLTTVAQKDLLQPFGSDIYNQGFLQATLSHLKNHPRDPSGWCEALATYYKKNAASKFKNNLCSETSIQNGNPITGLIKAYAWAAMMKHRYVGPSLQAKYLDRLDDRLLDKIIASTMTWGHLAGPGSASSDAAVVLKRMKDRGQNINYKSFTQNMENSLRGSRLEKSYFSLVQDRVQTITGQPGGSCYQSR